MPPGWHYLVELAEAADKPDVVAKIVREHQIDAATALELDDDDLRELVTKNLDFKKLRTAQTQLRAQLAAARRGDGSAKVPPPTAAAAHLVSSDSEDDASDGEDIPPHVPRISNDEIDRAEALDARGGVFAATWRPHKGQPVAVALKAVDAVDLAEVFALRKFADPDVLVLYGVIVAGRSDVTTVAERPDAPLDVVLCGNPLPRVDSLWVARDIASALSPTLARSRAHAPGAVERCLPPCAATALQGRRLPARVFRPRSSGWSEIRARAPTRRPNCWRRCGRRRRPPRAATCTRATPGPTAACSPRFVRARRPGMA